MPLKKTRVIGFLTDLESPHRIKKGAIIAADPDFVSDLIKAGEAHGARAICDLTLAPIPYSIWASKAFSKFISWWPGTPLSTLCMTACAACAGQTGISLCLTCKGIKKVSSGFIEGISLGRFEQLRQERKSMIAEFLSNQKKRRSMDS